MIPRTLHAARALAVATVLLAARRAAAGPTGLTFVPTTDVVPFRQVNAVVQNGNTTLDGRHAFFRDLQPVPQLEVGLPWHVEGGVDVAPADPPGDYRPMFNLKWTMLAEGRIQPAVAAGVAQLGPGFPPAGFAVVDKTLNWEALQDQRFRAHHRNMRLRGVRMHAGFLQAGAFSRAMLGADVEISDHFLVWADWISGAANALSLAGVVVVDRQTSVYVALLRENDANRLAGVVFNLTYTFDW